MVFFKTHLVILLDTIMSYLFVIFFELANSTDQVEGPSVLLGHFLHLRCHLT